MLANSHLNKNVIDKEKYIRDAKGTAKKAGLSEEELDKLAIKIESINSKLVPIVNDQKIDYKVKNLRVASLEKDVHKIFEEKYYGKEDR